MIDIVPGDVVVCVDAGRSKNHPDLGDVGLVRHAIYRVTWVGLDPFNDPSVKLAGVALPITTACGYSASRFRKVKKADTDFTEYMRKMRPAEKRVDA